MKRHSFEPESPAGLPSGPAPPPLLQTRPYPPGPGVCVFTELLAWSKKFFAFHTRTGEISETSRHELAAGLGSAIRSAEEFLKD
jgi:hypothetical protein